MKAYNVVPALLALCLVAHASGGTSSEFPLRFERNGGQTEFGATFAARAPNYSVFLAPNGASLRAGNSSVRMTFIGANPSAESVALDPLDARVHYMVGSAEEWRTDLPSYGRLEFRNVYPGIDIVYYGDPSQRLEYDFVLHPGSEPSQIRLRFEGAERIHADTNGDMLLRTAAGEWRHTNPAIYQLKKGKRHKLAGRFRAEGPDEVAFDIGEYDRTLPLVIDPTLTYSTFLGGSGQDSAMSIAVDAAGNAYLTGYTESLNFPAASGSRAGNPSGVDVYVAKLSPAGKLLYITYLGGSGDDRGYGIAVDSSGAAVVAGWTYSTNFPVVNGAQPRLGGGRDGFVAKLNVAGNALVFSTYLGGSGADSGNAVALDPQGNIYVAGETDSSNFPVLNGFQTQIGGRQDAFLAKFSSTGTKLYGTYLGGVGDDRAAAIAVDASGNAYVTGSTFSSNLPVAHAFQSTLGGGQDAFAAKIGPTGNALIYSTYLGGSGGTISAPEIGNGIAVDSAGCAYIAGTTSSSNFPTSNPLKSSLFGSQDAFVLKLSASGSALVYSTYLGGSSIDMAMAIAVDSTGRAYLAGYTASTDFPTVSAVQSTYAGGYDAFLARLSPAGSALEMATYLGGTESDCAYGIALDVSGGIYLAGQTLSPDFPTASAIQMFEPAAASAWAAKVSYLVNPQLVSPAAGSTLSTTPVTFTWASVPGAQDYWIDVGTSAGHGDIHGQWTSGAVSLTVDLTGHLNGQPIYVQLFTKYPGLSLFAPGSQYQFQSQSPAPTVYNPQLVSPTPGSTLSTASVTFTWAAVPGAQDYWIDVGTSVGHNDIHGQWTGGAVSLTVDLNGHLNGQPIYVQLYAKFPGLSLIVPGSQYQFQSQSPAPTVYNPQLVSPTPGSTLSTASVTFTWAAVPGAQDYWIDVGTSAGHGDIHGQWTSGAVSLTVDLTGHLNGQPIYVQLFTKYPGLSLFAPGSKYQFQSQSPAPTVYNPQLVSPTPGSTLSTASVTFTWAAVPGAQDYWIDVGTSVGHGDIHGQWTGGAVSLTVDLTGHLNGQPIYVQLYAKFPSLSLIVPGSQYQFQTPSQSPAPTVYNPQLVSPTPGSTLSTAFVTFTWAAVPGAQDYWIDVGTSAGHGDIHGQWTSGAASLTVDLTGHLNGQPIYVQLFAKYPGLSLFGPGSQFQFQTSIR